MPRFARVVSAGSGEAALKLVEEARLDVLLVDYQLPGMDGLERRGQSGAAWGEARSCGYFVCRDG